MITYYIYIYSYTPVWERLPWLFWDDWFAFSFAILLSVHVVKENMECAVSETIELVRCRKEPGRHSCFPPSRIIIIRSLDISPLWGGWKTSPVVKDWPGDSFGYYFERNSDSIVFYPYARLADVAGLTHLSGGIVAIPRRPLPGPRPRLRLKSRSAYGTRRTSTQMPRPIQHRCQWSDVGSLERWKTQKGAGSLLCLWFGQIRASSKRCKHQLYLESLGTSKSTSLGKVGLKSAFAEIL